MSGEVFNYHVSVHYGDKTYNGCGTFINERYKLNDFWELNNLNGSELGPRATAGHIPALQFDLTNNKVFGNTGCNRLNGTVDIENSSMSLSKMATTRKACPGDLESRFLNALQKVDRYTIARLLLMNQTDTLMVFKRAE